MEGLGSSYFKGLMESRSIEGWTMVNAFDARIPIEVYLYGACLYGTIFSTLPPPSYDIHLA